MKLPAESIALYAKNAGFSGVSLVVAVAVALAESGGESDAHNGDAGTGDDSWGLWQINMIGALGEERRREFGIADDHALLNPAVNASAAYRVWEDAGRSFAPWSTYKGGEYQQFMTQARLAAGRVVTPPVVLTRYLRYGCYGDDVRACQKIVGCLADGIFGPVTEGHVRTWQLAHGLTVDGIVGPQTCASFGWLWRG